MCKFSSHSQKKSLATSKSERQNNWGIAESNSQGTEQKLMKLEDELWPILQSTWKNLPK